MDRAQSQVEQTLKVQEWIATGRARQLREAARLSRTAVARDCNVDQQSVMRWETGTGSPRGCNISAYYQVLAQLEAAVGHTVKTRVAEPVGV